MDHLRLAPSTRNGPPLFLSWLKNDKVVGVADGFVLRYDTEHGTDGLPGSEGAFLACTFWVAGNYAPSRGDWIELREANITLLRGVLSHCGPPNHEFERDLLNGMSARTHRTL